MNLVLEKPNFLARAPVPHCGRFVRLHHLYASLFCIGAVRFNSHWNSRRHGEEVFALMLQSKELESSHLPCCKISGSIVTSGENLLSMNGTWLKRQ